MSQETDKQFGDHAFNKEMAEPSNAQHLRDALRGCELDVIALLVNHRGWEMLLGWSATERRWEAHGEFRVDADDGGAQTADGVGASIREALDACADTLDQYYEAEANAAPHTCAGCIGGGPCDLEIEQRGDEFCPGCGSARDEACRTGCPIDHDDERGEGDDPDDVTGPDTPRRARSLLESLVESGEATPEERERYEAARPCSRCGRAERDHVCFVGGEG